MFQNNKDKRFFEGILGEWFVFYGIERTFYQPSTNVVRKLYKRIKINNVTERRISETSKFKKNLKIKKFKKILLKIENF